MKASNRATQFSPRVVATLTAGILIASGLAIGSAAAESRPTPVPHRGTLFSEVQLQTPHSFSVASTGDTSMPWQIDPRKDGRNVVAPQPQEHRTNVSSVASTGDTSMPWQLDPRRDGRNVMPSQPQEPGLT